MRARRSPASNSVVVFVFGLLLLPLAWPSGNPPGQKGGGDETVLFQELPPVETAALYAQTLKEAPANVTVITQEEIRRYGYRTLAEALANVRGFYVTNDGALYYLGVRGFSQPGDYNTRILVLLNGHYLTDNVYGAMYLFAQDFGVDMDLIQRIEVVRGPSSALYGSNGVFATINIFTRAPAESKKATLSTEVGSFGEKKTLVSASHYLGRGAHLLVAGSGFHTAGRSDDFPGFGSTGNIGAEHGYHGFAQLTWQNWSLAANFADRKLQIPTGWFSTDFGNPGTSSRDAHNFVEAVWTRDLGRSSSLRWRVYYDQFRYFGRYDYTEGDAPTLDERDDAVGDWVGSRFVFRTAVSRLGYLTLGAQVNFDLRNHQYTYYFPNRRSPYRDTSQPDRSYGLFAQQEWNLSKHWTLFLGARFDDSRIHQPFVSPRLAAVYQPSGRTAYKFIYGRAFRNPSTYERFWLPNPLLEAERMHSFEFAREQRLHERVDVIASVFHYCLSGLIEGVPAEDYLLQYRNVADSRATGIEFEVQGRPLGRLETAASVSFQRARYVHPSRLLPNSPARLGQFRAAAPVLRDRLILAAAARYLSPRNTLYDSTVGAAVLADLTVSTHRLHPNLDLQFGLRNLANRPYADPLSEEHLTPVMPRAGRSLFLKLTWHTRE